MCAKKKAVHDKMWRIAGEPLRSQLLNAVEREVFSEEFSTYRQFRSGTEHGPNWVTPAAARLHQSAAEAVAAYLCEQYDGRYRREDVVKAVSTAAAVPAPLAERMARHTDFLLGAALWLLDYCKANCKDSYLSLLPTEYDELLEFDIPFSEDLEHSQEALLRTLTLLQGREGKYRREYRTLLVLIDDESAQELRRKFKAAFLDYIDRILKAYIRLRPAAPMQPLSFGTSLPSPDFELQKEFFPSEQPETIALLMAPELICRPVSEIQTELDSRKVAELLSGNGTDDPYTLCAAYLLLEREKDALANLNGLTAAVMICAERHLPWSQDDIDARAQLFEQGGPDYRLRHEYRIMFEDDPEEGEPEEGDSLGWLASEAQLFYIATGVIPPRNKQPSEDLVCWLMSYGVAEQRAREMAWGAMFAYYTDAGEHGWKELDWPFDDDRNDVPPEVPEKASEEPPAVPVPTEDQTVQIELLTRKVKELRGALHDAERAAGRLKEQLRDTQRRGDEDRSELAQLRETLYNLRAGEDSTEQENDSPVVLPWQVKRRTLVFGGHDSWCKTVKPLLPGTRFYDRDALPDLDAIRGADVVWIQANALSHKHYYRIIDTARKNGILVRYFGFASAKRCAVQLALDELAAEKN